MKPKPTRAADLLGIPKAERGFSYRQIELEPYQVPPPGDDWDVWVFLGGRGSGKTLAGACAVINHLREAGSKARVGIGAPTLAAARDVCMEGETGLITLFGDEFSQWNPSRGFARHRDGGKVYVLGSEEPARWNGPQWSFLWADELALWVPASWAQADLGLRLGPHPRAVITTTPKGADWIQELSLEPRVATTRATTFDNPHLSVRARDHFRTRYEGTTLGRQELYAEWLGIVEGAIFPDLQGHLADFLKPLPRDLQWARTGAGIDWGTTEAHQSAIVSASITKAGEVWIRRVWKSPIGSSNELVAELGAHKRELGVNFARIDRSQSSLKDPIDDLGISCDYGTRDVDWRIALMLGLIERKQVFFDLGGAGVREFYDSLCHYRCDDNGKVYERGDDDVDACLYLIAELMAPYRSFESIVPGYVDDHEVGSPVPEQADPNRLPADPWGWEGGHLYKPTPADGLRPGYVIGNGLRPGADKPTYYWSQSASWLAGLKAA